MLAKIFRMLPLILADLDMRANELFGTQALSMLTSNEMFINVLFTPEEKTFQYRVTSITTGGFQGEAGPYKTRTGRSHGVKGGSRAFAERRCLDLAVERMREMHAPDALGALWKV